MHSIFERTIDAIFLKQKPGLFMYIKGLEAFEKCVNPPDKKSLKVCLSQHVELKCVLITSERLIKAYNVLDSLMGVFLTVVT